MTRLWDEFLPLVQDLNNYGGNFTAFNISETVLNAVDAGSSSDPSLASLKAKLHKAMGNWSGLQDHQSFSALFEAYYEAVFLLVARHRGVDLHAIPAGPNRGNTPDFETKTAPRVCFEVKTIDVSDPERTYDKSMEDLLDSKIEAQDEAKKRGIGMSATSIAPHGGARDRRDVVEQVMKKIDGNIKSGQYEGDPTFLVVSVVRSAIHGRAENLRKRIPFPAQVLDASGQLYAIAAHQLGDPFYFFEEWGDDIKDLGAIDRAGILRDHPYIAGIIFLDTEWSKSGQPDAIATAYQFNGVWNPAFVPNSGAAATLAQVRAMFDQLCHAWNDIDDGNSASLPVR